jgi:hydroxymethylpyrimidine/phosphomethylpyrimidine kinase
VPVVLTIAGSDSIGGAGVQADLKAIASLGVHGASVITAVTAQNTKGVRKIIPLQAEDVLEQLEAVAEDTRIDAVKVGMLYSPAVAKAVGGFLCDIKAPAVVDPVLFAGVGDTLHGKGLLAAMEKDVLPTAAVVTPNRYEAEALASMRVTSMQEAEEACRVIARTGARSVLLKGGHMDHADIVDIFYEGGEVVELRSPRLPQKVHGGGCTISSYIASFMGLGMDARQAVIASKRRIYDAIALSYKVGGGMNVIDPLATLKKQAEARATIEQVQRAVSFLESRLDPDWIAPGSNLVFALPNPQGYDEVCAVEGGLVRNGKHVMRAGEARFGASRHTADIILALTRPYPEMRACLSLDFSTELLLRLVSEGLTTAGRKELEGTAQPKRAPDALINDSDGSEAMIYLIGLDPTDLLRKVSFLLERGAP